MLRMAVSIRRVLWLYAIFLETIADLTLTNLALNKPAQQISTEWTYLSPVSYKPGRFLQEGNASFAVDGNAVTAWENATCSNTKQENIPWWMVDLQGLYPVEKFAFVTPYSPLGLKNFTVLTAPYLNERSWELIQPSVCYRSEKALVSNRRHEFPCYSTKMARYFWVEKHTEDPKRLSLCEAEVFGTTKRRFFEVKSLPGRRSHNHVIDTVVTSSVTQCAAKCRQRIECTSFNLAEEGGACELVEDPIFDLNGNEAASPGWTRYTVYHNTFSLYK